MSSGDFVHEERVRFRDLDPMGHVNNAVFLTYLEQARVAFFSKVGAATGLEDMNMIVARVEIDFKAPVRLGQDVEISVRASRFGTKSFDLDYELREEPAVCDTALKQGHRDAFGIELAQHAAEHLEESEVGLRQAGIVSD